MTVSKQSQDGREGFSILVGKLRAGRPRNFVSIATGARIYLRCHAPTPTQAPIGSYSMEIGRSFPEDKAAGAYLTTLFPFTAKSEHVKQYFHALCNFMTFTGATTYFLHLPSKFKDTS